MNTSITAFRAVLSAVLFSLLVCTQVAMAAESREKRPDVNPSDGEEADRGLPKSARAERRVANNPHDRNARLDAARAQLAEGAENSARVEAAQRHVNAVLEEHPNDVAALLLGGQTSLLKSDAASAARYYRAAVGADANNASAYLGLGDALMRMGDEAGANAAFARYRQLQGMEPLDTESSKK